MKTIPFVARLALAGFASIAGVQAQATQVVIGQVAPMSGLEASQGRAYAVGLQLYFNFANKTGVARGHTFTLVRKDDGGRHEDTVAATRQLLDEEKDKPLVLAGYFGSRNVADVAASGLLQKHGIALVGYRTSEIRAETPFMYSVRAGLRDEINKLTEHLATIGITRLGLFYEDGPGAPALITAMNEAAMRAKRPFLQRHPTQLEPHECLQQSRR